MSVRAIAFYKIQVIRKYKTAFIVYLLRLLFHSIHLLNYIGLSVSFIEWLIMNATVSKDRLNRVLFIIFHIIIARKELNYMILQAMCISAMSAL